MKKQSKTKAIAIFEGHKIRRLWDEEKELWHFSVVDVVGVLSGSVDAQNYWKVLKNRLKKEGSEVVTKCNQLKLIAGTTQHRKFDRIGSDTNRCQWRLFRKEASPFY